MVTESNIAFTLLLSTVKEPDVGPLRTSTSTVATPSLLPSFTVNWNRYLDPLLRKGVAPLMSTDLGSVTNAYESPLGIYSWVICKLLRLTKANPGGKGKMWFLVQYSCKYNFIDNLTDLSIYDLNTWNSCIICSCSRKLSKTIFFFCHTSMACVTVSHNICFFVQLKCLWLHIKPESVIVSIVIRLISTAA